MEDILKFAMQMELDGRQFYLNGAEATRDEMLKKIFMKLADEEHRHFHIFKKMLEGDVSAALQELKTDRPSLAATKSLFKEMTDAGVQTLAGESEREVWREAREVEEKTVKLYADEAAKTDDAERRKLLNVLADEERTHVYLIENILGFLQDPQGFQESQNFKNFMSWEGHEPPGM